MTLITIDDAAEILNLPRATAVDYTNRWTEVIKEKGRNYVDEIEVFSLKERIDAYSLIDPELTRIGYVMKLEGSSIDEIACNMPGISNKDISHAISHYEEWKKYELRNYSGIDGKKIVPDKVLRRHEISTRLKLVQPKSLIRLINSSLEGMMIRNGKRQESVADSYAFSEWISYKGWNGKELFTTCDVYDAINSGGLQRDMPSISMAASRIGARKIFDSEKGNYRLTNIEVKQIIYS